MTFMTNNKSVANSNLIMNANRYYRTFSILFMMLIVCSCGNEKSDLLISDGTVYKPQASFPQFSWETTPMYYHFGDIDRVLEPDEVKFIAERTGFVCIEKSHAFKMLGDAVLGTKHEVKPFIKSNLKQKYCSILTRLWPGHLLDLTKT